MMWQDQVVEEIKRTSAEYASRFDYDIHKIVEDLKEMEKEMDIKSISFVEPKEVDLVATMKKALGR